MKTINKLKIAALVAATALWGQGAMALGTAAATNITNTARADYNIGVGGPGTVVNSNTTTTTVDELIDVTVTWQDASAVTVTSGDVNKVLTFLVTNTGNGSEVFNLSRLDNMVGSDNFDPNPSAPNNIFIDTNGDGNYDVGIDQPVTDTGVLGANGAVTIFILSDITGVHADGDTADSRLVATSATGTGVPGAAFPGLGDGGVIAAVMGTTGGYGTADGTYIISGVVVTLAKAATITDQFGGTQAIPGATVTYTITATLTGTGTAANLVITDPVPTDTNYEVGSLSLNGGALTDGGGDDAGDYNNTNAGSVTVNLGNLPSGSPVQTVVFRAKIK